jgi:hypothetical protein
MERWLAPNGGKVFRLIVDVMKVTVAGLKFVSKNGSVCRLDEVQDEVRALQYEDWYSELLNWNGLIVFFYRWWNSLVTLLNDWSKVLFDLKIRLIAGFRLSSSWILSAEVVRSWCLVRKHVLAR